MTRTVLLLLALIQPCTSFKIVLDLNTYNRSELAYLSSPEFSSWPGKPEGAWAILDNSPQVTSSEWSTALASIGGDVISEDNPGSDTDCKGLRGIANGTLTAAFQYHETGGVPDTMLNYTEITAASQACGAPVIILTRAYWPNSAWRRKVQAVLSHPSLFGVAMEFNPSDYGKRNEGDFVNEVLFAITIFTHGCCVTYVVYIYTSM